MRQTLITDYFYTISASGGFNDTISAFGGFNDTISASGEFNDTIYSWKCLECGVDMGVMNPRQLCGKTRCYLSGLLDCTNP